MQDFIRNLRLLGIGLFYTGKEKIEETIADLIRKGEISEPEGRALIDELVAKSQAAAKDMEEWIRKMMSDIQAPMKKEIAEQKKKIEKLEKAGASKGVRSAKKKPKKPAKKVPRSPRKPRP